MSEDSAFSLKRFLVGKPIPSHLAHHERLSRVTGSGGAVVGRAVVGRYATDFILATLVVAGVGAFVYAMPISLVIATLLAIVAFSYRQTIHAYPTGGGAYIVAKENIGDDRRADRRGVAAGRLHADGGGEHLGRRAGDHVGVSAARRRIASRCASRSSPS